MIKKRITSFLPRDALHNAVRSRRSMSVCPYCIKKARYITKLFFLAWMPHHSIFEVERHYKIRSITPRTGICNRGWVGKFAVLGQYVVMSWKRYKIGLMDHSGQSRQRMSSPNQKRPTEISNQIGANLNQRICLEGLFLQCRDVVS